LDIDSSFRLNPETTNPGQFTTSFDRRFYGVVGARIKSANIPNTFYTVHDDCNTLEIGFIGGDRDGEKYGVVMNNGNYSMDQLAIEMVARIEETTISAWTITYETTLRKFKFAGAHGGGGSFNTWFIYSHDDGGVTDIQFEDLIGISGDGIAAPANNSALSNDMVHEQGVTRTVYITIPELFNGTNFSSNVPKLGAGIMAKIPVLYGSGAGDITYQPTESQMYNFSYNPHMPLSFDTLNIVCFALVRATRFQPKGYYIVDFNGKNINLTLEIVTIDEI
jgi:hypothetical protein